MDTRDSHEFAVPRRGKATRRRSFVLSLLIGCSVFGALYVAAPSIILLRADSAAKDLIEVFRVDLRDAEPRTQYVRPSYDERSLSSKPGSVRDLLERDDEEIVPEKGLFQDTAPVQRLADRLASEVIPRQHDLETDTARLNRADSKVVEIAEDIARSDIQVARRLVTPSPDVTLSDDALPSFRGAPMDNGEGPLQLPDLPVGVGGSASETAHSQGDEDIDAPLASLEPPPLFDPIEFEPVVPEQPEGLPELPIETEMARQPVQDDVRNESKYEFLDDMLAIELTTYEESPDEPGFFRLRIVPREDAPLDVLPKDVTFVIDASNSIMQRKLDLTARGIRDAVMRLRPEDRFNVVVFRDNPTYFRQTLTPATPEAKAGAMDFLETVESRGETDVYNAIRPVIQESPREGAPSIVVVASDGRPTTGVMDGRDIINALTDENTSRNAVYAFGGGRTVNRFLLDLLAYRNKGMSRVAQDMNDIDTALPQFVSEFSDPILVQLQSDYGQIPTDSVFPREVPDFYLGRAVTVYGRYERDVHDNFVMRLKGHAGGREKEVVFKADLDEAPEGDAAIARNWAFQKVYYLIGEICRVGETPELINELRALSQKYNIETSYAN